MKKITYIFLLAAMALGAVSCSQESPFDSGEKGNGYGRVLTSSLALQLKGEQTRAANDTPSVNDFTVEFYNTADTQTPVESYEYSEMPEIVTLPAGITYKVIARHGDNPESGWGCPYYYGESSEFKVDVDKIVDNIDPITCKLSNVKVTVNFDQSLAAVMSADSKVTVKVGTSGELTFNKDTQDNGYFAYVEGSNTLIATFTGTVEDKLTNEVKTYSDVKAGVHYNITFRLHSPNAAGTGTATPDDENKGISVDAAVTIDNIGGDSGIDVTGGDDFEEIILDDESERPVEGDDPNNPDNPDDPNQGDDPTPPTPSDGPTITAQAPINLDDWNQVDATSTVVLNISSNTGITEFIVDVISETLDLSDASLSNTLDLVNPGENLEALQALGLLKEPENEDDPEDLGQTTVGGETNVTFDISRFMGFLYPTFAGDHIFKLTVSDKSGTTVKELKLRI